MRSLWNIIYVFSPIDLPLSPVCAPQLSPKPDTAACAGFCCCCCGKADAACTGELPNRLTPVVWELGAAGRENNINVLARVTRLALIYYINLAP